MWCNSVRSTDPRKEVCGDNRVFVFCWRVFVIGKEEEEEEEVWDNWRKKKVLMISHRWEWVTSKLNTLSFSFLFYFFFFLSIIFSTLLVFLDTPKKKGSSTPTNSLAQFCEYYYTLINFFFFSFLFYGHCQFCSAFFFFSFVVGEI